jgi:hypothetical protein
MTVEKKEIYEYRYGPNGFPTAMNPLWGVTHAHGQCVGFFTEWQKCYVQSDVPERDCSSWKEDYNECKLHLKEVFVICNFCVLSWKIFELFSNICVSVQCTIESSVE